ncbi:MAG: hypothetical protein ACKOAD_00010 [Gammaproteobacteria bacterium]
MQKDYAGSLLKSKDLWGRTPLIFATQKENFIALQQLFKHPEINSIALEKDVFGYSAFDYAKKMTLRGLPRTTNISINRVLVTKTQRLLFDPQSIHEVDADTGDLIVHFVKKYQVSIGDLDFLGIQKICHEARIKLQLSTQTINSEIPNADELNRFFKYLDDNQHRFIDIGDLQVSAYQVFLCVWAAMDDSDHVEVPDELDANYSLLKQIHHITRAYDSGGFSCERGFLNFLIESLRGVHSEYREPSVPWNVLFDGKSESSQEFLLNLIKSKLVSFIEANKDSELLQKIKNLLLNPKGFEPTEECSMEILELLLLQPLQKQLYNLLSIIDPPKIIFKQLQENIDNIVYLGFTEDEYEAIQEQYETSYFYRLENENINLFKENILQYKAIDPVYFVNLQSAFLSFESNFNDIVDLLFSNLNIFPDRIKYLFALSDHEFNKNCHQPVLYHAILRFTEIQNYKIFESLLERHKQIDFKFLGQEPFFAWLQKIYHLYKNNSGLLEFAGPNISKICYLFLKYSQPKHLFEYSKRGLTLLTTLMILNLEEEAIALLNKCSNPKSFIRFPIDSEEGAFKHDHPIELAIRKQQFYLANTMLDQDSSFLKNQAFQILTFFIANNQSQKRNKMQDEQAAIFIDQIIKSAAPKLKHWDLIQLLSQPGCKNDPDLEQKLKALLYKNNASTQAHARDELAIHTGMSNERKDLLKTMF